MGAPLKALGLLPGIFLNPIVFLAYLFIATSRAGWGIIPGDGVNISRIVPSYYLAFAAACWIAWLIVVVGAQSALTRLRSGFWPIPADVIAAHLFAKGTLGLNWLTWVGFAATAFVGKIWVDGMEGNIMGFFGLPILLGGVGGYLVGTFGSWGLAGPVVDFSVRFAPIGFVEGRGFFGQFICCALLNPFFLWAALTSSEKNDLASGMAATVFAALITTVSLYGAWLALNWGILRLTGAGAPWAKFATTYFRQAHALRGFQQLGTIAIVLVCLVTLIGFGAGVGQKSIRGPATTATFILVIFQVIGAGRAFLGARAALGAPPNGVSSQSTKNE